MRVARPITPDDAAPSVQSHYRTFVPTMSNSAPVLRLGTQALARATRLRISLCIGATSSYVPHPRLNQDHAAFMPDASGAVDRSPSTCFAGQSLRPGFDVTWGLSTRPQRFTYVRLPDSYLTEFPPPFSTTLTTTTLDRRRLPRFEACACTPTSRDLPSSWMKHRLHHCRDGDVRSTLTPDPLLLLLRRHNPTIAVASDGTISGGTLWWKKRVRSGGEGYAFEKRIDGSQVSMRGKSHFRSQHPRF